MEKAVKSHHFWVQYLTNCHSSFTILGFWKCRQCGEQESRQKQNFPVYSKNKGMREIILQCCVNGQQPLNKGQEPRLWSWQQWYDETCSFINFIFTHLCMKLVITQIQWRIDWFEGLKVYVDFLFFAIISDNCSTVNHKTVDRNCLKNK